MNLLKKYFLMGSENSEKENKISSKAGISDFAAYIPAYDNGNAVIAITKDGQTIIINKSIKAFIKGLLKENGIDYNSVKKNIYGYVTKKTHIPLPISVDTILIPVKTREKIPVNDGAYSYINLFSIEKMSGDKNCVITLKCGRDIKSLESFKTVEFRIKTGNTVMERFSSKLLGDTDFKECLSGIKGEYDKAATKGDMMIIAFEIMKLRNMLAK